MPLSRSFCSSSRLLRPLRQRFELALDIGALDLLDDPHEGDVHGAVAEAHLHLLRLAVRQQLHLGAGELRHLLVLVEEAGRSIGADLPRREERHLHRPFGERLQTIEKIRRRFLFFVYFSPNPASICRGFPFHPSTIVSHGSTDDIFQSALINSVTLVEIDCSPLIAFKAGVEELVWIWKACALKEGQFYLILVSVGHGDESIVIPTRSAHPFPFLDYLGVSIMNDFAKIGKHFAAPVRKVCDLFVNKFGWFHRRCTSR